MRKELILPANCKGGFVAYESEREYTEKEVCDEEEDCYVTEKECVDVNTNGIIMFQMGALSNVNLKCYGESFVDFYWKNCMNCKYRLYDDCIGGISVHRNGNCKLSSVISSEIEVFVERDIPEHLMLFDGNDYYFFVEHKDEAVALSLSNVERAGGSWCTGKVDIDKLDINKTYNDFWDCTRNGDYTPSLYINNEVVFFPTTEQLLREWSPDKLVFGGDSHYYSEHIDLDLLWLSNRQEQHYLDFKNNSYYLTNNKPDSDSYFIELEEGNYLEIV